MGIRAACCRTLGLAIGLATALACATPTPEPALGRARLAIDRAERADARRYAPAQLAVARDELAIAEQAALDSAHWIEARRLAERAEVEARFALEQTMAEKARISLQEIRRSASEVGSP